MGQAAAAPAPMEECWPAVRVGEASEATPVEKSREEDTTQPPSSWASTSEVGSPAVRSKLSGDADGAEKVVPVMLRCA